MEEDEESRNKTGQQEAARRHENQDQEGISEERNSKRETEREAMDEDLKKASKMKAYRRRK